MNTVKPDRNTAFELLKKFNKNESLIKHALAVEAVMRHFAEIFGEDTEKWELLALFMILIMKCT